MPMDGDGTSTGDGSEKAGTPDGRDTQDAPLEHTHDTNDSERISGIVAQTRGDLLIGTIHGDVRSTLQRRLGDIGISLDDGALDDLVARVESDESDVTDPGVEQL